VFLRSAKRPDDQDEAGKESEEHGARHNRANPVPAGMVVMVGARNPPSEPSLRLPA
jgi:hypothetical protein